MFSRLKMSGSVKFKLTPAVPGHLIRRDGIWRLQSRVFSANDLFTFDNWGRSCAWKPGHATFVNGTVRIAIDNLTKTECHSIDVKTLSDRVCFLIYGYEHPSSFSLSANMELFNTSEPFLEHVQKLYSEQPLLEHVNKLYSERVDSDNGEPIRILLLMASPELNSAIRQLCRAIDSSPYPHYTLSGQYNLPFIHEGHAPAHPVASSNMPNQNKRPTVPSSELSKCLNSNSFIEVRFVPRINGLRYAFLSSSFRGDRVFRFDTSGSSRRVVDWTDDADSKIHTSIRKAVDFFIKTQQCSNVK